MSIERVEPYEINIKANMGDSSLIVNGMSFTTVILMLKLTLN